MPSPSPPPPTVHQLTRRDPQHSSQNLSEYAQRTSSQTKQQHWEEQQQLTPCSPGQDNTHTHPNCNNFQPRYSATWRVSGPNTGLGVSQLGPAGSILHTLQNISRSHTNLSRLSISLGCANNVNTPLSHRLGLTQSENVQQGWQHSVYPRFVRQQRT